MKKLTINATVPENKEKGTKEMKAAIVVNAPENIDEAKAMFGGEAVVSNALANWVVTLQGNIRSSLKKGMTPEQIQEKLKDAKMGVAQAGGKVDPVQAYLALFGSSTPEKQKEMLAELQKKAQDAK